MVRIFKRKSPADAAIEEWMAELHRAEKRAQSIDDDGLVKMVRESGERSADHLIAAQRLGDLGRLDLLKTLLVSDDAASQSGGIDGVCTAACNGREGAVELLADLPDNRDPELRLRGIWSLMMVADGTPGDLGSSTREIRQAAASILERFTSDSDVRVSLAAKTALGQAKNVDDVRHGADQLTYPGRRVAEEMLRAVNPADLEVVAWGHNSWGECSVPPGLAGVTMIAAGDGYSLALTSRGTVVAWGRNIAGRPNVPTVPTGLAGVTAIAAGHHHSLALTSQGTVVAWGGNSNGECSVPAGLAGVTAIAAGGIHSLALTSQGTVVAWGSKLYDVCSVAGLAGVTAIAAGASHSLALRARLPAKSLGTS